VDPIFTFGTDEQKKKYLPDLLAGKKLGCLCLTEPQAGSDAGAIKTTAKPDGDTWVLNGTKQFITNAVQADVAIVFALTDPKAGNRGISAFIVEKSTPGFKVGKLEHKLGITASSTAEVIFEDCKIPKENLLGGLNKGFKVAMVTLDGGRIGIAAQALGIAKAAIEDAIAYAKERVQFNKPIAAFQGIKWYIAEMVTEYEAAWLLTYNAALMKDKGVRYSRESAMAKLKASEVCEFCASKCVQIHGGYGYIKEFDAERYFRDSKITQIYEGTSEIQREIIAGLMLK
jgi:alkylation response protein AidB-like acyl-CoA dehydrogenase